jgi:hypothetical protein
MAGKDGIPNNSENLGRTDREFKGNRRIRKRMYGGVRGRESRDSLLLD